METTPLEKPVKLENVKTGQRIEVYDTKALESFSNNKNYRLLETTFVVQYWDDEHGWTFTLPLITYKVKEEVDNIIIKISELFPSYRFRNHEEEK